jgi:putative spermidine/putrescine transport system permease protein
MKRASFWSWLWIALGVLYFLLPLIATLNFSLRARRGVLSLDAYRSVFSDSQFYQSFGFSTEMAVLTIIFSVLLLLPTAYWIHLRMRWLRPVVELVTLLPFVIPGIVLVFGLIKTYSGAPFALTGSRFGTNLLLVGGYIVLSFPYMYRSIDTGLRAVDVQTLTEAAQSLGAGWTTLLFRVIFPNVRVALLSGAFLTFAIVIGELTLAQYLLGGTQAFGPYLALVGRNKAYEPSALAIISFALIWAAIGIIQLVGRGSPEQRQLGGMR